MEHKGTEEVHESSNLTASHLFLGALLEYRLGGHRGRRHGCEEGPPRAATRRGGAVAWGPVRIGDVEMPPKQGVHLFNGLPCSTRLHLGTLIEDAVLRAIILSASVTKFFWREACEQKAWHRTLRPIVNECLRDPNTPLCSRLPLDGDPVRAAGAMPFPSTVPVSSEPLYLRYEWYCLDVLYPPSLSF